MIDVDLNETARRTLIASPAGQSQSSGILEERKRLAATVRSLQLGLVFIGIYNFIKKIVCLRTVTASVHGDYTHSFGFQRSMFGFKGTEGIGFVRNQIRFKIWLYH